VVPDAIPDVLALEPGGCGSLLIEEPTVWNTLANFDSISRSCCVHCGSAASEVISGGELLIRSVKVA